MESEEVTIPAMFDKEGKYLGIEMESKTAQCLIVKHATEHIDYQRKKIGELQKTIHVLMVTIVLLIMLVGIAIYG